MTYNMRAPAASAQYVCKSGTHYQSNTYSQVVGVAQVDLIDMINAGCLPEIGNARDKLDGTTAPATTDDSDEGFAVGSMWVDVTGSKVYFCSDATPSAAVWLLAAPLTGAHNGTAGTGFTAVEEGDGTHHKTTLTVSTTLGAIAGGAALGLGKLAYTFPAGAILVNASKISIGITQTQGHINADTPVVGLGTVVASGAVAVLSGTATFQDIMAGQAAANCTGTATVKTAVTTTSNPMVVETTGGKAHTVYLNVAATWAASGDAAAIVAGTIEIDWVWLAA